MKKDVIYARVSTKDQREAEQIPAIIKGFNLKEYSIYKEQVSAWNIDKAEKRFEFNRLIEDIKNNKIRRVYIWHIDRLYRNRKKTREFFNLCFYYNVDVYSLNQKWLNDFQKIKEKMPDQFKFLIENMYNLMLDVYAQTAEDESKTKSERIKLKVVKKKGKPTRSTRGRKWGRRAIPKGVREKIIEHHKNKRSIRWIAENVHYYDKNKNMKKVSVGVVHKTIHENKA